MNETRGASNWIDGAWAGEGPRRSSRLAALRSFWSPNRALLFAVGVVVVLVTLPMLRSLALRSNELDALRTLDLMGREVFAAETPVQSMGELFREDGELLRRLPDTRLLEGGRLMFHHGYLFELVPTERGALVLRAWPLAHGETGLGAFSSPAPGRLLGHPNSAARWSGPKAAPPLPAETQPAEAQPAEGWGEAWRPVQLSDSRSSGM